MAQVETTTSQTPDAAMLPGALDKRLNEVVRAHMVIGDVHQQRCASALDRYVEAARAASGDWFDKTATIGSPLDIWRDAQSYGLDVMQRSVLFWDTLRERGNNWIEHEKAGKPPLLAFEWDMIADARQFEKPVNYALVEIRPPEGTQINPEMRPFVIIDPRAGHGPGIGGFKQDSQVGVAAKAGHPVYFVIFFPEPVPGQTLADVSRAEAEFLKIIAKRHPKTRKPVVVGNCQGGWAAMLVGAFDPELTGPIVINGAPMSYWAGNDGENPMRYAGGVFGGVWPALLASDLGGGQFDGSALVDNFEYLNPANTYFDKYYTLYSKIDTEPPRFLEFERWWGGYFMMDRNEIKWIVENLFVGNKLAAGEAEWSEGRAFDLRAIRSPIILFASLGDNITPPQQAFNWVADLYPTTESLKANGQVIVGLMHKSVGHLGIFVSGQVARREHSQIVDLIAYIEQLPPGLYGMQVEEQKSNGSVRYDVVLTERRVEDLQLLQAYGRKDERAFEAVDTVSKSLAQAYEKVVHPVLAATVSPEIAKASRILSSQRVQRWAISDINPWLWPVKTMAEMVRTNRAPRSETGFWAQNEKMAAAMISASWDFYRDLRDASVENMFFRNYGIASILAPQTEEVAEEQTDEGNQDAIAKALSQIEAGGRTKAVVRIALLFMKEGTGRRRLSAMKRTRELVGEDVGLLDLPPDVARTIINEESFVVDMEPEKALAALPKLLKTAEDRQFVRGLFKRLQSSLEINPKQDKLLRRIQQLLFGEEAAPAKPPRRAGSSIVQLSDARTPQTAEKSSKGA